MIAIDTSHGCESGGGVTGGMIPVHEKASSACCGAGLTRTGDDPVAYACASCGKPTTKVLADPVAYWTCTCGQKRQQVITRPADVTEGS